LFLWFNLKHRVCFERKERENRGGFSLGKGEKGRGYGQNNHLLPPLPHDTERKGTVWPAGGGGRGAGDPGHGDGRDVGQNREEVEGNSFRSSPWSGTDCGGRSTDGGRSATETARAALVVAMESSGGRGMVVEVRDKVGSRSGPFIGAGRSVWRGYFELRGASMAFNGGGGKISWH
jgi:hypothetical protein